MAARPEPDGDGATSRISAKLLRDMQAMIDGPGAERRDGDSLDECLSMLERVWPGSTTMGEAASNRETIVEFPSGAFGRFRVLRMLGEGGFGAVFLVQDAMLGREVALKIPQPALVGSREVRQRFLREAQAAALLDHPNIVPIYESGEVGAMWYIVSGYCSGPSLADWLARESVPPAPRLAARIVADLADAVQHAHTRGVLHRDLKPSNVLLEPFNSSADPDFRYLPKLTDFGLAKRMDEQQDVTRTGVLVGTVRYMAPEQASGDFRSVGIQTDVYALGVILYELISGNPPFAEPQEAETLRRIQQEPIPALRSPYGRVSRDLETICLKCLEKLPSSRYATAADVAAELRRYLAGEPVVARPVSIATRGVRWCRRRPVVSGLSLALAATLIASSVGSIVMLRREMDLRKRAESRQVIAIQAVNAFYTNVAENWFSTQPHSEGIRKEYLTKALAFFEELAGEQGDDPEIRYRRSVALHRMANIEDHLRMTEPAVAHREACLETLEALMKEFPENAQYRYDHFYNLLTQGTPESLCQAYDEIQTLLREDPRNPTYLDALAAASVSYGERLGAADRDRAERLFQDAVRIAGELTEQYPDKPLYEKNVAVGQCALAALAAREHNAVVAERQIGLAISIYERLAKRFADQPHFRMQLAGYRAAHAGYLETLGQVAAARQELIHCENAYVLLFDDFRNEVDVHGMLISILMQQGEFYLRQGNADLAHTAYERAIKFLSGRIEEEPKYMPHRLQLAALLRTCPVERLRNPARAAELERRPNPVQTTAVDR